VHETRLVANHLTASSEPWVNFNLLR